MFPYTTPLHVVRSNLFFFSVELGNDPLLREALNL